MQSPFSKTTLERLNPLNGNTIQHLKLLRHWCWGTGKRQTIFRFLIAALVLKNSDRLRSTQACGMHHF
jgi:hypothetical protein